VFMAEKTGLEKLLDIIKAAGPAKLAAALAITGLVAAALFAIMFRVGAEPRALLYADLTPQDASAVTTQLETSGIEYQMSPDGSTIFVPRSQVADARMQLAAEGLPGTGSVGYEIFDQQDALGATTFVQNVNKLRALEGELARSINSLDSVRNARVHLVIPEKTVFQEAREAPTASIVVGLERGTLGDRQVQAIRSLVASAVPGLAPEKITLLDERGQLLAGAEGDGVLSGALDDRKAEYEERLRRRIQEMVEGVTGPGTARVQVSAEMDFAQVSQTEETFDPEGSAPRSTRTVEETGNETNRDEAVTQGQNVPDGTQAGAAGGSQSASNRTDETINYEISRTTRTEVTAPGKVERLSIAVAVDGTKAAPAADAKAGDAPPAWSPRSEEEMTRITALVRSAAGINAERGDTVEVVNVQFARAPLDAGAEAPSPFAFDKSDIMRGVEILVMALIALALVFFVARPLIKGVFSPPQTMLASMGMGGGALAVPGANGAISLPGGDGSMTSIGNSTVDIARIEGAVNANAMKQVSSVVSDNPEQTVAVIRSWLQERK
jgi:flagellar M-ring protein FliF